MLQPTSKFGRWFKLEQWYLVLVGTPMGVGIFSVWFFGKYNIAGLDVPVHRAFLGGFAVASTCR